MFDPDTIPNFDTTPYQEVIEFTRAVSIVNGDYDHPIQDHLDHCERVIAHLELCFLNNAYFK